MLPEYLAGLDVDWDLAYSRCCANTKPGGGLLLLLDLRAHHYSSYNEPEIHTPYFGPTFPLQLYISPFTLLLNSLAHQPLQVISCIQLTPRGHRARQRLKLHGESTLQVKVLEGGCLENTNISCSFNLGGMSLATGLFALEYGSN